MDESTTGAADEDELSAGTVETELSQDMSLTDITFIGVEATYSSGCLGVRFNL